jgi:hypothetical protein
MIGVISLRFIAALWHLCPSWVFDCAASSNAVKLLARGDEPYGTILQVEDAQSRFRGSESVITLSYDVMLNLEDPSSIDVVQLHSPFTAPRIYNPSRPLRIPKYDCYFNHLLLTSSRSLTRQYGCWFYCEAKLSQYVFCALYFRPLTDLGY